ncbi:MAG TPA: EutN/CcmL family microcompartment protein [Gemmataceae bacterium]|jgi:ethanolamine utilization protein EutN|nr:EutN/CcmL family microcompartment protein [Gemmataceae bacterium]
MRICEVIGTVTLSRPHPSLAGFRFVIGVPFSRKALLSGSGPDGEDLVISDDLGAGAGMRIAISESTEAAAPFYPEKKPIDAYCACLLDSVTLTKD